MLCFRSEAHIRAWQDLWKVRGESFGVQQGWQLAQAWYSEDRRAPDWRRKTVDQAQAILSGIGLTSAFWSFR